MPEPRSGGPPRSSWAPKARPWRPGSLLTPAAGDDGLALPHVPPPPEPAAAPLAWSGGLPFLCPSIFNWHNPNPLLPSR